MSFLSSEAQTAIKGILGDMIRNFGKECKLHYHPIMVDCEACAGITQIGNKSSNTWTHGGPLPLAGNTCGICNGTNKKPQETTENIFMVVNWNVSSTNRIATNITLPYGLIQCRAFLFDLPKIRQAEKIEISLPSSNYDKGFYKWKAGTSDAGAISQMDYMLFYLERIN